MGSVMLYYDENKSQMIVYMDTTIVFEIREDESGDYIIVHSVVGVAGQAIEWCEKQELPILALGRPGWAKLLSKQRWQTEPCLLIKKLGDD